ncbi:hypothetical protein I548_1560 [Mycobacterium intracellulare]|nr:hypothetical protein L843_4533 [Mycobacterium intracellulare MIN_061107_1834]EUA28379.1 hypothetical protein I548_1560 [Mycobacterium intracellulare]
MAACAAAAREAHGENAVRNAPPRRILCLWHEVGGRVLITTIIFN